MPSILAGATSLFYEEKGDGEPVVFVHGIPTDYRAWRGQLEALSGGNRVISISRRCAGPDPAEVNVADSTVATNAADLEGFIRALGIAPANLVGHSFGGFVSSYLCRRSPSLVKSLVLVEPAIPTLLVRDGKSQAQMLSLLIRSPSVALAARRFQKTSLYPSLAALGKKELARAVQLNVDGVQGAEGEYAKFDQGTRQMMLDNARTIGELGNQFPGFGPEDLRSMSCRALVLNGAESPVWLRRIGELTSRYLPGSRRVVVPGSKHFPHIENPSYFNETVAAFLKGGTHAIPRV